MRANLQPPPLVFEGHPLKRTGILLSFSSGSALSVTGQVTYLFRQLGIFEEFQEKSLMFEEIRAHDGDCKPTYNLDFRTGVQM